MDSDKHLEELKAILNQVKSADELSDEDILNLHHNVLAIAFNRDDMELARQISGKSLLMTAGIIESEHYEVSVKANSDSKDWSVNVAPLDDEGIE